jgi:hypothetical protein
MCILCKNKKTDIPTVNLTSVEQTNVDRSLGLSNIYNISNSLAFLEETFLNPLYNLSGTTKPTSGFTTINCSGFTTGSSYSTSACTAVYNLSDVDEIDLVFQITGNTQYSAYTGNFCYHTFQLAKLPKNRDYVTKIDSTYSNCFGYSTITANTIYETINKSSLPVIDAEYIIKDYNIFQTQNLVDNLKVNTFDMSTQTKESLFDDGWYFVTTVNPDKPTIGQINTFDILQNATLITETPNLLEGYTSVFKISGYALNNKFIVFVNGILLTENLDWVYLSNLGNGYFEIISGEIEPTKDVIQVVYLNNPDVTVDSINLYENYLNIDAGIVNTITTGITSGVTSLTVNYNPVKNRQEILLTKLNRSGSSLIIVINGVKLQENVEYFLSSTDNSKLIINPLNQIQINDAISVFYFTDLGSKYFDLGYYRTLTPTILWEAPQSYSSIKSEDGKFLIQVTTFGDTHFLNPVQSKLYGFDRLQSEYSTTLDQLPTNVGEKFLLRICFFKNYHILFDNVVTTRSVSDTVSFKVNIDYAKNSY